METYVLIRSEHFSFTYCKNNIEWINCIAIFITIYNSIASERVCVCELRTLKIKVYMPYVFLNSNSVSFLVLKLLRYGKTIKCFETNSK